MPSHTLIEVAAPKDAVPPRIVPRPRHGRHHPERRSVRGSERTR
ncbi:hypothetical protein [Streptomyces sp. NPDC001815]